MLKIRHLCSLTAVLTMTAVSFASNAAIKTITFEEFGIGHGTVVNSQYQSLYGIDISADNARRSFDLAVAYDTQPNNPANHGKSSGQYDRDLEGPNWGNNNLSQFGIDASQYHTGNALIIQENNRGCHDGVCDYPDDEGSLSAGTITFDFNDFTFASFGFDLIDFQDVEVRNSRVTFSNAMESVTHTFASFASSSVHNAVFGDNSLNRIMLSSLGIQHANKAVFDFGGSGAIDNIRFSGPVTSVPEPATLLLFGAAGVMLFFRKRKYARCA